MCYLLILFVLYLYNLLNLFLLFSLFLSPLRYSDAPLYCCSIIVLLRFFTTKVKSCVSAACSHFEFVLSVYRIKSLFILIPPPSLSLSLHLPLLVNCVPNCHFVPNPRKLIISSSLYRKTNLQSMVTSLFSSDLVQWRLLNHVNKSNYSIVYSLCINVDHDHDL